MVSSYLQLCSVLYSAQIGRPTAGIYWQQFHILHCLYNPWATSESILFKAFMCLFCLTCITQTQWPLLTNSKLTDVILYS